MQTHNVRIKWFICNARLKHSFAALVCSLVCCTRLLYSFAVLVCGTCLLYSSVVLVRCTSLLTRLLHSFAVLVCCTRLRHLFAVLVRCTCSRYLPSVEQRFFTLFHYACCLVERSDTQATKSRQKWKKSDECLAACGEARINRTSSSFGGRGRQHFAPRQSQQATG
jgi:hypothetical protein